MEETLFISPQQGIIKDTEEQPDEEVHKVMHIERGAGFEWPLSPRLSMFTKMKLSKPCSFGFLWKLHDIGMTD